MTNLTVFLRRKSVGLTLQACIQVWTWSAQSNNNRTSDLHSHFPFPNFYCRFPF
jgi:hypothetical protein